MASFSKGLTKKKEAKRPEPTTKGLAAPANSPQAKVDARLQAMKKRIMG